MMPIFAPAGIDDAEELQDEEDVDMVYAYESITEVPLTEAEREEFLVMLMLRAQQRTREWWISFAAV